LFENRHILLGIGGGIAAYRVAELARMLTKQKARVRCVMTPAACRFITPLTFASLTGEEVHTELFDLTCSQEMGHIRLARWADALLVAPATANLLAKFNHGICDNLLTTLFHVYTGPVLLAPAMNVSMWESESTQRNLAALCHRGARITGPEEGRLACGEEGMGRMSEPEVIVGALYSLLQPQDLRGQRWLINAGPTWEAWDDVRVLGNRASGRLGAFLAMEAASRGARVDLVAGPGVPPTPAEVKRLDVTSAADMMAACLRLAPGCTVFAATAAVCDFRFANPVKGKLKRGNRTRLTVELECNEDIVASVARLPERPGRILAFAAESRHHVRNARDKLRRKGADAIFANDIAHMGSGTGSGWWITPAGKVVAPPMPKRRLAQWLIDRIVELKGCTKEH